jgi:hypothetical protein
MPVFVVRSYKLSSDCFKGIKILNLTKNQFVHMAPFDPNLNRMFNPSNLDRIFSYMFKACIIKRNL